MENFKIDVDSDGIALITFDVPGRSMNTITGSVMRAGALAPSRRAVRSAASLSAVCAAALW